MKFSFLPTEIENLILSKFNYAGIFELRIRQDKPIFILYYGDYILLTDKRQNAVYADKKLIEYILNCLTEMSVYRYNHQIKQGFIIAPSGVRVGLAGEVVLDETGGVRTIRNISSMVIRVPHEIKGCASPIIPFIERDDRILNTLIISPPGCGKTTIIRDLSRLISFGNKVQNILVADERYEISGGELDTGTTTDVFYGGDKGFCFESGTRALAPSVIITDEIGTVHDAEAVYKASFSGISVIATAHARNTQELKQKPALCSLLESRVFERIVVLSSRRGVGTIECVLDENFNLIAEDL